MASIEYHRTNHRRKNTANIYILYIFELLNAGSELANPNPRGGLPRDSNIVTVIVIVCISNMYKGEIATSSRGGLLVVT